MAELDAIKMVRIAGRTAPRLGKHDPCRPCQRRRDRSHPHVPCPSRGDPGGRVADELTLHIVTYGGFTEAGDSDLTDAEIRAQGRHRSAKGAPRYASGPLSRATRGRKSGAPRARRAKRHENRMVLFVRRNNSPLVMWQTADEAIEHSSSAWKASDKAMKSMKVSTFRGPESGLLGLNLKLARATK
jgi:hypothetical protein